MHLILYTQMQKLNRDCLKILNRKNWLHSNIDTNHVDSLDLSRHKSKNNKDSFFPKLQKKIMKTHVI